MEVHRQRCQHCGSLDLCNILRRLEGRPTAVFVRCSQCHELVARYELSSYYHHGKGFESWLRSRGKTYGESGRSVLEDFNQVQKQAVEGYHDVLIELERLHKDV